jgi:histidyl-tRNA synthetase
MPEKELAKLFYIANTFIFEETGKKNREKWQSGAELIGMGSPLADVELIALALEVLKRLGFADVELKLSHAGLTRGLLQKLGLNAEVQTQIFDRLLDGDPAVISQLKSEKPELAPLLALHGKSSGFVKNLASSLSLDMPELKPQIDDFVFIADSLQSLGYHYQIDIASVRGFEYYTGVMFQLLIGDERAGGGGRYDALIPAMGGKKAPASGFALDLDLLFKLMANPAPSRLPRISLRIDPETAKAGFDLADELRKAGYIVKIYLGGKGPTDTTWELAVMKGSPQLVLTDLTKHKKYDLQNSQEVMQKLGD